MDVTEYIDEKGRKFTIRYRQATMDEKDSLWFRLAATAAEMRK